jgi:hypothetical protein
MASSRVAASSALLPTLSPEYDRRAIIFTNSTTFPTTRSALWEITFTSMLSRHDSNSTTEWRDP